jgi:parallel beta-helix repeat protein
VKRTLILLTLGSILILSTVGINRASIAQNLTEFGNDSFTTPPLTPHSAITITSNSDFAGQGWPGNGTEQSPYVIDSLEIVTDGTCITIASTDVHFIISNCSLSSQTEASGRGIFVSNVSYGVIFNNTIHDKEYAVRLNVVNYLEIRENRIHGCAADGIYMVFTSGVVIAGNRIYGNANLGLNVYLYTLYSEIYDNMIGFNSGGNANDDGLYNEWDDGSDTGNIWSDYSGTGSYSISGIGVDHYPRGFLSRPADVQYVFGSSFPPVAWEVRLPNPNSYTMFWEGEVFAQGSLNSSLNHLSKAVDGLAIGLYNLTLVVNDRSGYSVVDTVIITVLDESTTSTETTSTSGGTTTGTGSPPGIPTMFMIIGAGAVGGIAVVVFIMIRKK